MDALFSLADGPFISAQSAAILAFSALLVGLGVGVVRSAVAGAAGRRWSAHSSAFCFFFSARLSTKTTFARATSSSSLATAAMTAAAKASAAAADVSL